MPDTTSVLVQLERSCWDLNVFLLLQMVEMGQTLDVSQSILETVLEHASFSPSQQSETLSSSTLLFL